MSDVRLQVSLGQVTLDIVASGSGSAARVAVEGLLEPLDYGVIDVSSFIRASIKTTAWAATCSRRYSPGTPTHTARTAVLGGGTVIMVSMKIDSNNELFVNWGAASALGVVLLVLTMGVLWLAPGLLKLDRMTGGGQ